MKAPAFQFYPADFMMGTMAMTAEEVGGYIRLLCFQWENGPIPDNEALLSRITGCGGNAVASIRNKFVIANGKLANSRLEKVRQGQIDYRHKQAQNAQKRWDGNAKPDAMALPSHIPNGCSLSSSPSPTITPVSNKDTDGPLAQTGAVATKPKREIPTFEQWLSAAKEMHPDWPEQDAKLAWEHYEKVGWKSGRNIITKWRMAVGGCYQRWYERNKGYPRRNEAPKINPKFDLLLGSDAL